MKIFISLLFAASLGYAAAYLVVNTAKDSQWKNERAILESQFKSEKERFEAELAAVKTKKSKVEQIKTEVAVVTRRSPKEILDNLLKLQPSGATRISTIRKIVHELEDLADSGNQAVPDIRKFLATNSDLDYSVERTDRSDSNDRRNWMPPWQRSTPPTEFTLPPSLRIGLFDVLKDIGGEDAVKLMGEVLGSSGRAVEVAYLTRALEEIVPGQYREVALTAAKDLLRNPIAINSPNRLDEQAEGYLFGILELYNDASFVEDAKKMLVNAEGRLNRNAQQYLTKFQGVNMVSTYFDLYKSESITNNFDKMNVATKILDYVGASQQANSFLNEIVTNTNLDSRMRSFAVMRLAGGFGGSESPTDPGVIAARMQVLQRIQTATTDERILQTLNSTLQNLEHLQKGEPVENPFERFRGGGRDQNENRNLRGAGTPGPVVPTN